MFTVELNGTQLCDPYDMQAEAEAFAAGYEQALRNNEITFEGNFELVTWELRPESPDGAVEIDRDVIS